MGYYMEEGLGYYYPAGTPAPSSEDVRLRCLDSACGWEGGGTLVRDLGAADLIIGGRDSNYECPRCGQAGGGVEVLRDSTCGSSRAIIETQFEREFYDAQEAIMRAEAALDTAAALGGISGGLPPLWDMDAEGSLFPFDLDYLREVFGA